MSETKASYHIKLILSSQEFNTIYEDGKFTYNYTKYVKLYLKEKLNLSYTVGKKFVGKKVVTISLNCAILVDNKKCNQHGSISIKLIDTIGDTVTFDVTSTCLHLEGKNLIKFSELFKNLFYYFRD